MPADEPIHPVEKAFARALEVNGQLRKTVIDKSGAVSAGVKAVNKMLKCFGYPFASGWVVVAYRRQ